MHRLIVSEAVSASLSDQNTANQSTYNSPVDSIETVASDGSDSNRDGDARIAASVFGVSNNVLLQAVVPAITTGYGAYVFVLQALASASARIHTSAYFLYPRGSLQVTGAYDGNAVPPQTLTLRRGPHTTS